MKVTFKIYQIGTEFPELVFSGYSNFVNSSQATLGLDAYTEVCIGTIEASSTATAGEILEKLFTYFNSGIGSNISVLTRLSNMRSMSVSDMVALSFDGGPFTHHYCDTVGFVDCTNLLHGTETKQEEIPEEDTSECFNGPYLVVKTHSPSLTNIGVDNGSACYCSSYEDAVAVLEKEYNEYLEEEIANHSILDEEGCYLREDVAQIKWTDCEWTRFTIIDDIRFVPSSTVNGNLPEGKCCGNCLYSRRIEGVINDVVCTYDKTPMIEPASKQGCSIIWKPKV